MEVSFGYIDGQTDRQTTQLLSLFCVYLGGELSCCCSVVFGVPAGC